MGTESRPPTQEMLAADLSNTLALARDEYDPNLPDVNTDDVVAALPAFLASLRQR